MRERLKPQRSISEGSSLEMEQIAVKQLDLLRHEATGFQDQTDLWSHPAQV